MATPGSLIGMTVCAVTSMAIMIAARLFIHLRGSRRMPEVGDPGAIENQRAYRNYLAVASWRDGTPAEWDRQVRPTLAHLARVAAECSSVNPAATENVVARALGERLWALVDSSRTCTDGRRGTVGHEELHQIVRHLDELCAAPILDHCDRDLLGVETEVSDSVAPPDAEHAEHAVKWPAVFGGQVTVRDHAAAYLSEIR